MFKFPPQQILSWWENNPVSPLEGKKSPVANSTACKRKRKQKAFVRPTQVLCTARCCRVKRCEWAARADEETSPLLEADLHLHPPSSPRAPFLNNTYDSAGHGFPAVIRPPHLCCKFPEGRPNENSSVTPIRARSVWVLPKC